MPRYLAVNFAGSRICFFVDALYFTVSGAVVNVRFTPVGIGIFFILIKRNRFLTVGQYQLSSLAVVASLTFGPFFDGIIGKHIDLVDLDARGLS